MLKTCGQLLLVAFATVPTGLRAAEMSAEQAWKALGLVGEVPVLAVVQDRFRNVPQLAYFDWYCRGPGNTAPECYAIDTDEE